MNTKVMIVDDEPSIRLTVRAVLEPRGFELLPVESGAQCIEELERGFQGVVLMDVMMPGMNGWETIKEIEKRGLGKGILISMLTAKQDPDIELREVAETVTNYIRKPFESSDLVATVTEYCQMLEDAENRG